MKALLSRAPGPPETLQLGEWPDPVAGDGEVVIAVRSVGAAGATLIPDCVAANPFNVSETVRDCEPAVANVTVNFCEPSLLEVE